jgi:hypothetical protein
MATVWPSSGRAVNAVGGVAEGMMGEAMPERHSERETSTLRERPRHSERDAETHTDTQRHSDRQSREIEIAATVVTRGDVS